MVLEGLPAHHTPKKKNPNPNITLTHHSLRIKTIPGKDYKLITIWGTVAKTNGQSFIHVADKTL